MLEHLQAAQLNLTKTQAENRLLEQTIPATEVSRSSVMVTRATWTETVPDIVWMMRVGKWPGSLSGFGTLPFVC